MRRFCPLFYAGIFFFLFTSNASANIAAKAVYVEGTVFYTSIDDGETYPVEVGVSFKQGDKITTGASSVVEIEFDTGALLLIDNNTELTITSLHRDENGTVNAVFGLVYGLIKSSFSKLADGDVIEYRTKAAIVGLAGTPEQIVEAGVNPEGIDMTNVYLLGEAGDEGSLYVRGFDPGKTEVTLFAGQGTTIVAGLAPLLPFIIGPELLNSFGNLFFHSGGGASAGSGTAVASSSSTGTGATTASTASTTGASTGAAATTTAATGMGTGTLAAAGAGVAGAAVLAGGASPSGDDSGDITADTGTGGDETSGAGDSTTGGTTTEDTSTGAPGLDNLASGTWSGSIFKSPCVGTSSWSMTLTQSGSTVSGTYTDSLFNFPVSGSFADSTGVWTVSGTDGRGTVSFTLSGTSASGTASCSDCCNGSVNNGTFTGSKE